MIIAILEAVDARTADHVLADNIIYRPDVVKKGVRYFLRLVNDHQVNAILASQPLPLEYLVQWNEASLEIKYVVYFGDHDSRDGTVPELSSIRFRKADDIVAGLKALEKQFLSDIDSAQRIEPPKRPNQEHITFVGAGLVNLISAHFAVKVGISVRFVDAGPDPRDSVDWTRYGCSAGGASARMFTLSEMDNYNCRHIHNDMNWHFSRSVNNVGWNVCQPDRLTQRDRVWIDEFERVPSWLADSYNQDIFKFSRESKSLWEQWIDDDPDLFNECVITRDILRVYSDYQHFQSSLDRQDRIGATIRAATADEVAYEQPILSGAVRARLIADGVYVHGFTVNVHRFISSVIGQLEGRGVTFEWDRKMLSIDRAADGTFAGVTLNNGDFVQGNVVISPGAYANGSLEGTLAHKQIAGVLGAWLTLPDQDVGLRNSLKLARKGHIVEDANITVAVDNSGDRVVIIGSGYGFTGFDPSNIDQDLLEHIYAGVIDTAQKYFGESYQRLLDRGSLRDSLKYCVRPWTPTGLGVLETHQARSHGRLIVVGGHNTGGFAQAPATGMAVIASIRGRRHDMHRDYRPDRFASFVQQ
jgi:glycine/D-amino acid oxidase-like deaminating enzyme